MQKPLGFVFLATATRISAFRLPIFYDYFKGMHIACVAERLMVAKRYLCLSDGSIECLQGWKHHPRIGPDQWNPCPVPECPQGCHNGQCVGPETCSCEVGWRGIDCSICIAYPGCLHGDCRNQSMGCFCDEGYYGAKCDKPICSDCVNGYCLRPGVCLCMEGWSGPKCDICLPSHGCSNGGTCLHNRPNTCQCQGNWTGVLCDQLICTPSCNQYHGKCQLTDGKPECVCVEGYRGFTCSNCTPDKDCPNQDATACVLPNQCICPPPLDQYEDPKKLCNRNQTHVPQQTLEEE